MPSIVKAQFALAATTLTAVYTAAAGRQVPVTIYICNRGALTTFRLSIAIANEVNANKQYLYYDSNLPANNTLKESFVLTENDVIRVYAASANVSVTVMADESYKLLT